MAEINEVEGTKKGKGGNEEKILKTQQRDIVYIAMK